MSVRRPKFGLYLFGLFALLILSVIIALYVGATEEPQKSKPVEGQVTRDEMRDFLRKMNVVIGERSLETGSGQKAMQQTAAMIEGTLGPLNLGYNVSRSMKERAEGLLWTTLWVDAGDLDRNEVTILTVPYDESGTVVAFALCLAEYLVGADLKKRVRLVFDPGLSKIPLWQRVKAPGELMGGQLEVIGGGDSQFWGEISDQELKRVIQANPIWEESVKVGEVSARPVMKLCEKGTMTSAEHAGRLIRMMPVVVELLNEL